jgi:hypothetical protein
MNLRFCPGSRFLPGSTRNSELLVENMTVNDGESAMTARKKK